MEHSTRLAHISEDGTRTQTVYDHLAGTARLAGSFAAPFGAQSEAEFAAWLHDVGKYSDAFQLRLKGGPKVDHSTAGAQEAWVRQHPHAAFAVAGHHSGLPDGGSPADDPGDATLFGRSKKPVAPYDGWQEVTLPASTPPAWACADPLSLAFFTRMLYSCLVDANGIFPAAFLWRKTSYICRLPNVKMPRQLSYTYNTLSLSSLLALYNEIQFCSVTCAGIPYLAHKSVTDPFPSIYL